MSLAIDMKNQLAHSFNARVDSVARDQFDVLIVDDESSVVKLLCKVLSQAGFSVSGADDGLQALDMLSQAPPKLIVTDLRMPNLNGVELIERAQASGKNIPCIFMTGFTDYENLARAIKLQPYGFLEKPFSPQQLLVLTERAYSEFKGRTQQDCYTDVLYETVQERTQELAFRTERLLAEKELLQGIIGSATFGLIAVDTEGTVHLLNGYARELTCTSTDPALPFLGQTLADLFRSDLVEEFLQLFSKCREVGKKIERKLSLTGFMQRLHVVVYPIRHRDNVTAIVFVIHDITEMEQLQNRLMQTAKLASIGELAAGVAHEINNPLGFVTSNCGTLNRYLKAVGEYLAIVHKTIEGSGPDKAERSEVDTKRKELDIDYIIEDGQPLIQETMDGLARVSKIVTDLKTFARVDNQEPEKCNIETVLDDALNLCRNETKYKLEIIREYTAGAELNGFPTQLAQVFTNIIVNAAQAAEEKGTLRVSTAIEGGQVLINFADNGPGMPEHVLSKIFDPFFTTKAPGKGTGMGLSISYGIIKRHGGTIVAESIPEIGTTFFIRLPLEGAKQTAAAAEAGEITE